MEPIDRAIVTCSELPELSETERPLLGAMTDAGIRLNIQKTYLRDLRDAGAPAALAGWVGARICA